MRETTNRMLKPNACPACFRPAALDRTNPDDIEVRCGACGVYRVTAAAELLLQTADVPTPQAFEVSYAMRSAQREAPDIVIGELEAQAILLRRLSEIKAGVSRFHRIIWDLGRNPSDVTAYQLEGWAAVARAKSLREIRFTLDQLIRRGLIEERDNEGSIFLVLTGFGLRFFEYGRDKIRNRASRPARNVPRKMMHKTYAAKLDINSFKCFAPDQSIDFCSQDGRVSKWTFLVGENGVGKTSILQLIAGLYPVFSTNEERRPDVMPSSSNALEKIANQMSVDKTGVSVRALFHQGDLDSQFTNPVISGVSKKPTSLDSLLRGLILAADVLTLNYGQVVSYCAGYDRIPHPSPIFGYGAGRLVGSPTLSHIRDDQNRFESLFDISAPLSNPEEWMLRADYSTRLSRDKAASQRRFDRIRNAIIDVLPDAQRIEIMPPDDLHENPWVGFVTSSATVPYSELSAGYQSMAAWIVDLALQLQSAYPDSIEPLAEPCIVLIDEIDLHLHPRWQRAIISHLDAIFPQAQFIATTHSPLVIQGAINANLTLLRREEDGVHVVNDVDEIQAWRVDQILTSELFGLESARPDEIANLHERRNSLLAKSDLTAEDWAEVASIKEVLDQKEPYERAVSLEDKADLLVKSLLAFKG